MSIGKEMTQDTRVCNSFFVKMLLITLTCRYIYSHETMQLNAFFNSTKRFFVFEIQKVVFFSEPDCIA